MIFILISNMCKNLHAKTVHVDSETEETEACNIYIGETEAYIFVHVLHTIRGQ